jgi:hypothetical protein
MQGGCKGLLFSTVLHNGPLLVLMPLFCVQMESADATKSMDQGLFS